MYCDDFGIAAVIQVGRGSLGRYDLNICSAGCIDRR